MLARHALFALLLVTVAADRARADAPSSVPPAPAGYQWQLAPIETKPEEPMRWYRGEMVLADAAAVGVGIVGLSFAHSGSGYRSLEGYYVPGALAIVAAGPIVHGLHHDGTGAVESVALRVGLPLLGAMLGSASYGKSCYDGCGDTNFSYEVMGGIAGAVTAMIIDDGFLAHERPQPKPSWTPVLVPTRNGGATVGLGGTF